MSFQTPCGLLRKKIRILFIPVDSFNKLPYCVGFDIVLEINRHHESYRAFGILPTLKISLPTQYSDMGQKQAVAFQFRKTSVQ